MFHIHTYDLYLNFTREGYNHLLEDNILNILICVYLIRPKDPIFHRSHSLQT